LISGFLLVEVFDKPGAPRKIIALDKKNIESVDVLGTIGCKWTKLKARGAGNERE
jgi:hypothetical protein